MRRRRPKHREQSSAQSIGSGAQQCDTQFLQYVGVPPEESIYNYVDFAPDAQTWQGGDRELACVAYAVTDAQPNGAVLWTSIKGSAV